MAPVGIYDLSLIVPKEIAKQIDLGENCESGGLPEACLDVFRRTMDFSLLAFA